MSFLFKDTLSHFDASSLQEWRTDGQTDCYSKYVSFCIATFGKKTSEDKLVQVVSNDVMWNSSILQHLQQWRHGQRRNSHVDVMFDNWWILPHLHLSDATSASILLHLFYEILSENSLETSSCELEQPNALIYVHKEKHKQKLLLLGRPTSLEVLCFNFVLLWHPVSDLQDGKAAPRQKYNRLRNS